MQDKKKEQTLNLIKQIPLDALGQIFPFQTPAEIANWAVSSPENYTKTMELVKRNYIMMQKKCREVTENWDSFHCLEEKNKSCRESCLDEKNVTTFILSSAKLVGQTLQYRAPRKELQSMPIEAVWFETYFSPSNPTIFRFHNHKWQMGNRIFIGEYKMVNATPADIMDLFRSPFNGFILLFIAGPKESTIDPQKRPNPHNYYELILRETSLGSDWRSEERNILAVPSPSILGHVNFTKLLHVRTTGPNLKNFSVYIQSPESYEEKKSSPLIRTATPEEREQLKIKRKLSNLERNF
jgi:hypothetical protein